jgi:hypothetical protein
MKHRRATVSQSTERVNAIWACQRYSRVRMRNNPREFPQPKNRAAEIPADEQTILCPVGGRRFRIQWIFTEVNPKPAQVISIQTKRQAKKRPRKTQT